MNDTPLRHCAPDQKLTHPYRVGVVMRLDPPQAMAKRIAECHNYATEFGGVLQTFGNGHRQQVRTAYLRNGKKPMETLCIMVYFATVRDATRFKATIEDGNPNCIGAMYFDRCYRDIPPREKGME